MQSTHGRSIFASEAGALYVVSLALMMFEINLVRLFSVIMQHHLAFFVLAIALFGFGLGGLYAQLSRRRVDHASGFPPIHFYLPLFLALAVIAALFILVILPLHTTASLPQVPRIRWLLCAFLVAAAPFFFGSMFISQIFAARPERAGKLYFADLLGAGSGCMLAVPALQYLGGLTAPFAVATIAALATLRGPVAGRRARAVATAAMVVAAVTLAAANVRTDFVRSLGKSSLLGTDLLFSKWNFYSRIGVFPWQWRGWRLSDVYDGPIPDHLVISQDGRAPAFMVHFDGDHDKVRYLEYDVTSMPYRIADPQSALIIGVGGGRDILTAKHFGVPNVTGVELNPIIANEVMRDAFRDYSGDVYNLPGVEVIVDSGRTFSHHVHAAYDLVFASFADSQSASSQGASVLSENHLYTSQAFQSYWDCLTPNGILCVAGGALWDEHWLLRMVNTLRVALERRGVTDPERHILAVVTPEYDSPFRGIFVAATRSPLPDSVLSRARVACQTLGYDLAWPAPAEANAWAANLTMIFDDAVRPSFLAGYAYDVRALSDDRPYMWYALKPRSFLAMLANPYGNTSLFPLELRVLHILMDLFLVVFACVLTLMVSPLVLLRRRELGGGHGRGAFLALFFLLGVGYVLIELALLQHFFLWLGNPTLAFAAMLSVMLIFTGIGSLISSRLEATALEGRIPLMALVVVLLQVVALLVIPVLGPQILRAPLAAKAAATVLLLAVLATPMGMLFPSAIRLLGHRKVDMTCWAWAMNGIGSVLGSVSATMISLNLGIAAIHVAGIACYTFAILAAIRLRRASRRATMAG
ncbi:MAG TPA: hypothetical protein PLO37_01775 [Candidatus Hydrogenedentes bacterium]|nr:hypothetical protein [Candidatus Hydrogenedentota bacterium]HPG65546.1 hypothetical protein [Candidatus Hydrogenedentota bacterium]